MSKIPPNLKYKFRAECSYDVLCFSEIIKGQISNLKIIQPDSIIPDVNGFFESKLQLQELVDLIKNNLSSNDLHVIAETLQLEKDYTGIRANSLNMKNMKKNIKKPIILYGPPASGKTFLSYLLMDIKGNKKSTRILPGMNNIHRVMSSNPFTKLIVIDEVPENFCYYTFILEISDGFSFGLITKYPKIVFCTQHYPNLDECEEYYKLIKCDYQEMKYESNTNGSLQ